MNLRGWEIIDKVETKRKLCPLTQICINSLNDLENIGKFDFIGPKTCRRSEAAMTVTVLPLELNITTKKATT